MSSPNPTAPTNMESRAPASAEQPQAQQPQPQAQAPVSENSEEKKEKPVKRRKKKLEIACVYCRRSHMICDESRPCQRCIKRGIGHLCYDEPSNPRQRKKAAALRKTQSEGGAPRPGSSPTSSVLPAPTAVTASQLQLPLPPLQASPLDITSSTQVSPTPQQAQTAQPQQQQQQQPQSQIPLSNNQRHPKIVKNSVLSQTLPYNQQPFFYSEHAGSEFSSLNDFLSMIDDPELVNGALNDDPNGILNFGVSNNNSNNGSNNNTNNGFGMNSGNSVTNLNAVLSFSPNLNMFPSTFPNENEQVQPVPEQQAPVLKAEGGADKNDQKQQLDQQPVISDSARDKFFLTAADPTTEISPEERLKQVIKAKLEAGLLQPYNYAKGYARLQRYMDNYMNISSRQRILKPLSIFRPAFRAIARTLKDVDLVLVEESFERMLLDYDRVFTSMAIPACLWRRTGEIYRGNKEFASLVGVTTDDLKDGKLAIYELMSEESAVNFWEKYGAIAFDKGQKAVLTSCNLRTRDGIKRKSCCFSFTIRRDRYNIPSCIVGNFIPIDP
ncbi:Regulator of drug sensitivity 2 [Candida viswanathii]|uniref:Regulator of drug sensitivity 2 n=1 Tax=Candida viswanathii TaxID=5486 RepID=A0A367YAN3_9ASCO|nr:Regulator of drug sensitivity 2 [Candida viswanathii]